MEMIKASGVLTFCLETLLVSEIFNNGWKVEQGDLVSKNLSDSHF